MVTNPLPFLGFLASTTIIFLLFLGMHAFGIELAVRLSRNPGEVLGPRVGLMRRWRLTTRTISILAVVVIVGLIGGMLTVLGFIIAWIAWCVLLFQLCLRLIVRHADKHGARYYPPPADLFDFRAWRKQPGFLIAMNGFGGALLIVLGLLLAFMFPASVETEANSWIVFSFLGFFLLWGALGVVIQYRPRRGSPS